MTDFTTDSAFAAAVSTFPTPGTPGDFAACKDVLSAGGPHGAPVSAWPSLFLALGGADDSPDATAGPHMFSDPDVLVEVEDVVLPVAGLSILSSPDSKGDLTVAENLSFSRSSGVGETGLRLGERRLRELED